MSQPQSPVDVLVLDDGELDDLVALFEELQLNCQRLRGGAITGDHQPPLSLLVATPRRADAVARGAPEGAVNGRPLRVISSDEDSTPMRAMLRRQGFDLLVRRPTHREIWRLLIHRALYQGNERRSGPRVPVGSEVAIGQATSGAVLVDVSNRGGHLLSPEPIDVGSRIAVTLPAEYAEGEALELRGEVVRSIGSGQRHSIGLLFDRDLSEAVRQRLGSLLNSWIRGGESLAENDSLRDDAPLPACESPAIPGLTLDAETDPAVLTHVEVALRMSDEDSSDGAERRRHLRSPFMQTVEAKVDSGRAVLIGRDLSAGGMRIEPLRDLSLGDRFEIAIYRPDRPEPFRVSSEIVRDDGDQGLGLSFIDVDPEVATGLEKLVACLPDVEPLQAGETDGLGTVIAEIVSAGA